MQVLISFKEKNLNDTLLRGSADYVYVFLHLKID